MNKVHSQVAFDEMKTPVGSLYLYASDKNLLTVSFNDLNIPYSVVDKNHPILNQAQSQLCEYFSGQRRHFDLPLKTSGTDFQNRVWRALLTIPFGQTQSYGQIAQKINRPKAARAVGMANNKNPIVIIIPCHRVIGASGQMVGYGGGLSLKEWLLNHELSAL